MCPACLATAAGTVVGIAAGVSSIGGVAAIIFTRLAGNIGEATDGKTATSEGEDMEQPRIVSRDEWLAARRALLVKEKAHTRAGDAISAERRRLPMVKIDTPYVFDTPKGRSTLADLFEGRGQLIVYHFMMGPGWIEGCPSCSFLVDHLDGAVVHLANRDVTLIAVSRAPLSEIEA